MNDQRYVYFLAHAGRDASRAEQLYDLLAPAIPTYLDRRRLSAIADGWDVELGRAQRASRATVALLSLPIDKAFYLRDEISAAVAYQRHAPEQHRLIVVYLDGHPKDPNLIPYGLHNKQALDAVTLGMAGVADELRRIAALVASEGATWPDMLTLPDAAASAGPAAPFATRPPLDPVQLVDCLVKLMPPQFDIVLLRCGAPEEFLSPRTAPLATRALDLVAWARQRGPEGLEAVRAAIEKVAPGLRC